MTRKEFQRILDALTLAEDCASEYCACIGDVTCSDCATVKWAIASVIAQLAKPEALEWRVRDTVFCDTDVVLMPTEEDCDMWIALRPDYAKESRAFVPYSAGPWEPKP